MKRFLRFLSPVKHSPALTVADFIYHIENVISEVELMKLEELIDYLQADDDFSDDELFTLHHKITYTLALFVFIEDHFPHDYYPPFAIQSHIMHADTVLKLDAIEMHLRIYKHKYRRDTLAVFRDLICYRERNLNLDTITNDSQSR